MDGNEPTRLLFHVNGLDFANRARPLRIGVQAGRVVLVTPPGEGITLAPADVPRLVEFLHEAGKIAASDDTTATDTATGTATSTNNRRPGDATHLPGPAPRPSVPTTTTHGERHRHDHC